MLGISECSGVSGRTVTVGWPSVKGGDATWVGGQKRCDI